jgi:hypothetical protein
MIVRRESPLTGKINEMDLPVTPEQMFEFIDDENRRPVQAIFPNLSPAEREFIKSGYTPEEMAAIAPPPE